MHRTAAFALRAFFLAATLAAASPSPSRAQPYLGLHLGGSFSTFSGSTWRETDSRRGLRAAAVFGVSLTEHAALQSEVAWVQKGARGTLQGFEEPLATDLKIDYVQVPLLVRFALPAALNLRPVLIAGGAVAFEAGCSVDNEPGELAVTYDCAAPDSAERLSSTDWSAIVGAGLEYALGRTSVAIEGRYDLGLREVGEIGRFENRALGVTLGVTHPLGR